MKKLINLVLLIAVALPAMAFSPAAFAGSEADCRRDVYVYEREKGATPSQAADRARDACGG